MVNGVYQLYSIVSLKSNERQYWTTLARFHWDRLLLGDQLRTLNVSVVRNSTLVYRFTTINSTNTF